MSFEKERVMGIMDPPFILLLAHIVAMHLNSIEFHWLALGLAPL